MENHLFNGKTHYTWPFSIATVDVKPPEGKSNVIILMTIFFFRFTAMHFFFHGGWDTPEVSIRQTQGF